MSNCRKVFFSFIAIAVFSSLCALAANAQRPNLSDQETQQWRQRGPCSDPWVSKAVTEYKGSVAGIGNFGDCQIAMYNGGSWNSYDELYRGVQTAQENIRSAGGSISASRSGDRLTIATDLGEGARAIQVLKIQTNAGGNLIGMDGSTLVASGGGNFRVQSTSTEKRVSLGKSVLIVKKK